MQVKTQGLIIREQTVGESDRLVTVLTRDAGVVRAFIEVCPPRQKLKGQQKRRNAAFVLFPPFYF